MVANSIVSWQDAEVVSVEQIADGIARIVLRPQHPKKVRAGEHIDIEVPTADGPLKRSYSIVEQLNDGRSFALTVFRTPTSRGGSEGMHELTPGQHVRITSPLQDFPLRIGAPRYVLLAGGIGITAIVGMARALRAVKADYRLIYCGRSRPAMAYLEKLREEHGDRFELHVDDEGMGLDVPALVGGLEERTELYMCGPIRLMDAVRRAWSDSGQAPSDLRFETFGSSGWFDPEPFRVSIPRLGVEVEVGRDESMLEALERQGVPMMSDCRKGECGICQVTVQSVEGAVDHRDVFFSARQKAETPPRRACACVSRVAADSGCSHPALSIDVG